MSSLLFDTIIADINSDFRSLGIVSTLYSDNAYCDSIPLDFEFNAANKELTAAVIRVAITGDLGFGPFFFLASLASRAH